MRDLVVGCCVSGIENRTISGVCETIFMHWIERDVHTLCPAAPNRRELHKVIFVFRIEVARHRTFVCSDPPAVRQHRHVPRLESKSVEQLDGFGRCRKEHWSPAFGCTPIFLEMGSIENAHSMRLHAKYGTQKVASQSATRKLAV